MAIDQTGSAIGTSATTVYTSSNTTAITAMFFMNDNASSRTLTIHVVKNGSSAGTSNTIVKNINIDGADSYVINTEKLVLDNGDTIQCTASAGSSIFATISSVAI